jgi:hypothetical protein
MRPTTIPPLVPAPNGDEAPPRIGSFHKTLPHDAHGLVDEGAYAILAAALADRRPGPGAAAIERVPGGGAVPPAPLVNPLGGRARVRCGVDPFDIELWPAPRVCSDSTAAEMTELFWLALWRDLPLDALHADRSPPAATVEQGIAEMSLAFDRALAADQAGRGADAGRHLRPGLGLGLDLPEAAEGGVALRRATLLRCGFPEDRAGPLVSQFLLHDVPLGGQTLRQSQRPCAPGQDYLANLAAWRHAQDTGRGAAAQAHEDAPRPIVTLRDLACWVHRAEPQQPWRNAALLLLGWRAEPDPGNPYAARLRRQSGFTSLGAAQLPVLIAEAADTALKAVWRQKWLVHRRLRPEAYGGLMTMQAFGGLALGLPDWVMDTAAAAAIRARNRQATKSAPEDSFLLPQAHAEGAPVHPAYGSGHAAVAGACATVLKAWFDETRPVRPVVEGARHPATGEALRLLAAQRIAPGLVPYDAADAAAMTVGGELNKLAGNIAMGRCIAGVNWRSDVMRGLRLGEVVATVLLARVLGDCTEADAHLRYRSFDGHEVIVAPERIVVESDAALQLYYAELIDRSRT